MRILISFLVLFFIIHTGQAQVSNEISIASIEIRSSSNAFPIDVTCRRIILIE